MKKSCLAALIVLAAAPVQVLDHDDALQIVYHGKETVVVYGYDGEPYVRVLPDGTVQVNERSPALALNDDEHQHVTPPAKAPIGAPRWHTLDRTGRFEWHDHRIHWRKAGLPPQVTDTARQTKVFDWRVPLRVGGASGAIAGTLTWVGEAGSSSGFPTAAAISLAVLLLLAVAGVGLVRRRRRADEAAERTR
jgi:MYXO-CTERM domain-containing protein